MTRVLLATVRLLEFMEGAGHFWAYMQYAQALRRLGCEVYVLDSSIWSDASPDERRLREFLDRMERYGLRDKVIVAGNGNGIGEAELPELLDDVDLLLNFNYHLGQDVVSAARRSALVDIDPGLLQFWISRGFISPAAHDLYFTIGETVGNGSGLIPDCGIEWLRIRPPVCLDLWPYTYDAERGRVHDRVVLVGRARLRRRPGGLLRQHQAHRVLRLRRSPATHRPAPRAGAVPGRVGRSGPEIARGTRLARPSLAGGRRQPRAVPRLRPGLARRVQLGEGVLHEVPERLDQRPQPLLPGKRKAGGGPGHRTELVPAGRRGHVPLPHGGGRRARHSTRSMPTTSASAGSRAASPRSTSTPRWW